VTYKNGSNWIRLDPSSGIGNATVRVDVLPANLTPGKYEATLVIDAGQAGNRSFPITVNVTPRPVEEPPSPTVTSVTNGASFAAGALVPGSLATVKGSNLAGSDVKVTFNGIPANVLYTSSGQLNFQVPAELAGQSSAQMMVTVNGRSSASQNVLLTANNPGVFVPGILNQDNSVNAATAPALVGSIIQIYATGLLPANGSGTVEARIHDRTISHVEYAGPAPGIPGVQQVNLFIPSDLQAMTTDLVLCSTVGGVRACSPPVQVSTRR
jgi:uncharacterized protein (TIGR03437 family)